MTGRSQGITMIAMGLYSIKPAFQKFLSPARKFLVRHHIGPTAINIAGLFASVAMALAVVFFEKSPDLLLVLPLGAFVRTACNALDGLVARELKVASSFGEVLNEFIDRINDTLIFGSLIFLPSVHVHIGVITLSFILLNSYLSILSKAAGGSRRYEGILGKADRMLWLGAAALLIWWTGTSEWWNHFLIFIAAGTFFTMGQRFIATQEELSR